MKYQLYANYFQLKANHCKNIWTLSGVNQTLIETIADSKRSWKLGMLTFKVL